MKWPPVVESWLYLDPSQRGDALMARSARLGHRATSPTVGPCASHPARDRYYTMARRLHIAQVMKGRR